MTLPIKTTAPAAAIATTVKHMAGMLWYNMLSELNKSGLSADTLGTGGDEFQDMFLWNVAQHDFGKYDDQLVAAATRQFGTTATAAATTTTATATTSGTGTPRAITAPAAAIAPVSPSPPLPDFDTTADITSTSGAIAAAIAPSPLEVTPSGDLATQAKNFAKSIWPEIAAAAQLLGVPPVAVLAQTALETGWGAATPGHNLFGIKAVDGQSATTRPTQEMRDGILTPQSASFRNYANTAASITDYVGQIESGFHAVIGQSTVGGFAHALQSGGYATDTNYAAKIITISQSPLMTQVLQALGGQPGKAPIP